MKISLGGITDNKHNKYFRIEGRLAIMNISKFTQKSVEAVQNCEKLAYEYGNPICTPVPASFFASVKMASNVLSSYTLLHLHLSKSCYNPEGNVHLIVLPLYIEICNIRYIRIHKHR